MKSQQYTITEHNDWEGETFSYVMMLTEKELDTIMSMQNIEGYEVEQTNYTDEQIADIYEHSNNGYAPRIAKYVFTNPLSSMRDTDADDVFYKSCGLSRIL